MSDVRPIYGDQLFSATDLNRQPGRVLDAAMDYPVTITRNDQAFALLRREEATKLSAVAHYSEKLVDLLVAIVHRAHLESPNPARAFEWLTAFDGQELRDLVKELTSAYHDALSDKKPWSYLDALFHEWEESARAVRSSEVESAFKSEPDLVPLTKPGNEVLPKREPGE